MSLWDISRRNIQTTGCNWRLPTGCPSGTFPGGNIQLPDPFPDNIGSHGIGNNDTIPPDSEGIRTHFLLPEN